MLVQKLEQYHIDGFRFLNRVQFSLQLNNPHLARGFNQATFEKDLLEKILLLEQHEIPDNYSDVLLANFDVRSLFVSLQGFALLSKNYIEPLAQWIGNRRVLEVMSGLGSLSYVLQQEGVLVTATDNYSATNFDFSKLWCEVKALDAMSAIEKYGAKSDIIIMSWPYTDEVGYGCLMKMREVNPNAMMIFIGEEAHRTTGSDSLYENMIEIHDEAFETIATLYPQWDGVSDKLYLIK